MSTITRDKARMVRHISAANGRPLCGGGNGGRSSQYQVDLRAMRRD